MSLQTRSSPALGLLAGLSLLASGAASAQTMNQADGYSLLPYTSRGYVGLNLGASRFKTDCAANFACDDTRGAAYVYTGGVVNEWLGAEIGYLNTGNASRSGGTTRGQGLDLLLLLRLPLGAAFSVFAKGGAVYGETKVSADAASGTPTGKSRGWGAAYGVGAGYDITPQHSVVLEWMRHELPMPGRGKQDVETTQVGFVYRF